MNLISSHDVNRAVNVLDKDGVNAARTAPVNDFVDGRHRLALAAALQFTLPGAPTIYYGDEVGLAGFGSDPQRDDPYNRQPYPWSDAPGYEDLPAWRQADTELLALYQQLGQLRSEHSFLRTGSWDTLAVDDDSGLYAYGRKDDTGAAVAVFNRGSNPITASLDLAGYVPANAALSLAPLATGPGGTAGEAVTLGEDGSVQVVVPPLDFRILLTGADADMQAPNPPTVTATEGNRELVLAPAVSATETVTVTEFAILRSLVNGGFTEIGRMPNEPGAIFADPDVANGTTYYYQVQAVGENGLLSAAGEHRRTDPPCADPLHRDRRAAGAAPQPQRRRAFAPEHRRRDGARYHRNCRCRRRAARGDRVGAGRHRGVHLGRRHLCDRQPGRRQCLRRDHAARNCRRL